MIYSIVFIFLFAEHLLVIQPNEIIIRCPLTRKQKHLHHQKICAIIIIVIVACVAFVQRQPVTQKSHRN